MSIQITRNGNRIFKTVRGIKRECTGAERQHYLDMTDKIDSGNSPETGKRGMDGALRGDDRCCACKHNGDDICGHA